MIQLIFLFVVIGITICASKRTTSSINGIYANKGPFYIFKFCLFYLLLQFRKLLRNRRQNTEECGLKNNIDQTLDMRSTDNKKLERPQKFSYSPEAFDAVFFSGANDQGTYLVIATERRPNNLTYGILYVLTPGKGLLVGDWLPQTVLQGKSIDVKKNKEQTEGDFAVTSFNGGGITLTPIEPMRKWRLQFEGSLRNILSNKNTQFCVDFQSYRYRLNNWGYKKVHETTKVTLDLTWRSDEEIFNYDTGMSPVATARAFAREPWNNQFFDDLKKAHQTHYEQIGSIDGEIKLLFEDTTQIKDKNQDEYRVKEQIICISMPSFRDHSYGYKRDWKLMHRYIFHHIFMENGTTAVVGIVSQPHTCSSLECGFVSFKGGVHSAVDSCTLKLRYHGEGGYTPLDYGFEFNAGGQEFRVQCKVIVMCPHHYLGKEFEARNAEHFMEYTINEELHGNGIAEWNYRHTWGIPEDEVAPPNIKLT